ncbi:MAG: NmrA/HSCARG family protein [Thermoplasmata archaeon]
MTGSSKSSAHAAPKPLLVLVTGVTGQQGGRVSHRLLKRGHRVRALVRDLKSLKLEPLRSKGVEFVQGSFDDGASIERAAQGVDAMFLMGTPFGGGAEAEARQGKAAVDAAKRASVPWLVYSSVSDADHQTGIPHFESKFAVEQHLRQSGVPFAISAPTAFMENILAPYSLVSLQQGKLASGTSPLRAVPMVALDDLGAFSVHLLENPSRFRGKRINVASDALNNTEAAKILSELTGRKIEYQQIPLEVMRAQSADYAKMFEWFERVGYSADIDGLRRDYPEIGWHRFSEWAAHQNWNPPKA